MPDKSFLATVLVLFLVFALATSRAQYSPSERIKNLLQERSIGDAETSQSSYSSRVSGPSGRRRERGGVSSLRSSSVSQEASAGKSIADRFRERIAAVHAGSEKSSPSLQSSIPKSSYQQRDALAPRAGSSSISRRRSSSRSRSSSRRSSSRSSRRMGGPSSARSSFMKNIDRLKRQRNARERGESTYTKAIVPSPRQRSSRASSLRERLKSLRRQSVSSLGAFRRSLTQDEEEKLSNWLRKNRFRNIHATHRGGESPLHRAVFQGHREIATLILCKGAEVDLENRLGETPLHKSSARGQGGMVTLLLKWQADPNIRDNRGETALQKAARAGHHSIVRLLLDTAADLNARCEEGCTALHEAAREGHDAIVEMLVNAGADVNVRCAANETAVQKAASAGHNEIARFLLEQQ